MLIFKREVSPHQATQAQQAKKNYTSSALKLWSIHFVKHNQFEPSHPELW